MEESSRISRSIKNIRVSLIYLGISVVLQFISRRVFIDRLGVDILGLNSTALNMLQFLNLAELGVGVAVGYALYGPLQRGDSRAVAEIVAVQGHLYRRVAAVIIVAAAVLSAFFPLIFKDMGLPLWYAYASFGVLLVSALLSYFVNYKQIVLSADQREFDIKTSYMTAYFLKVTAQIAAVGLLAQPYLWWLGLELAGSIAAAIALDRRVKRVYPYLKEKQAVGADLLKKYRRIVSDTKKLFVHRIATYVVLQSSPLVIYGCLSLAMVTLYGNYMIIVTGLMALMDASFNGMQAGVGKLVAEDNGEHAWNVFSELFTFRFFCSTVTAAAMWLLMTPLVTLWLGREYALDNTVVALITAIYFIGTLRSVVDSYKMAHGLFADVWAPVIEAALNLGLSIFLGLRFGLPGILWGALISLIIIVGCWQPYYVFTRGMKRPAGHYWGLLTRHLAAALIAAAGLQLVLSLLRVNPAASVPDFILYAMATCVPFTLLLGGSLLFLTPGAPLLADRLKALIKR